MSVEDLCKQKMDGRAKIILNVAECLTISIKSFEENFWKVSDCFK